MNKFIVKDKILNWKNRNFVSQKYSTFESRIVVRIKQTKTSKTEKLLTHTRVKKTATGANKELVCDKNGFHLEKETKSRELGWF